MALMTIEEVCDELRVSHDTIYKARNAGLLKHVLIGRAVRFRRMDVAAYVRHLQVKAEKASGKHPKRHEVQSRKARTK